MKEFALCLILILALAAGITWWSKAGPIYGLQPARQISVPPVEQPKVKPPVAPSKPKRIASAPVSETVEAQPVAAVIEPAPVVAEPLPPPPPPPFPSGEKIESGAEADAIVETYGKPSLSAITSDKKHLMETFIYARDTEHLQTLIRLEDGKVMSAYSLPVAGSVKVLAPGSNIRH